MSILQSSRATTWEGPTVVLTDCRIAKRKQQMSLPMRRQLGYQPPGKKEDKRTVLLTEDITEALTDVSNLYC